MTIRFVSSSDTSIVVEFGDKISRQVNDQVLAAQFVIEKESLPGVQELIPTFRSLMIQYDPLITSAKVLLGQIQPLIGKNIKDRVSARYWEIPVCYDKRNAFDLEFVAREKNLTTKEVIKLHLRETYHVYMIGFLPGYPYMGDLDVKLQIPRRKNPRVKVPKGSVSIATSLTAIYPTESPGGWHLIGATPFSIFHQDRLEPSLLSSGDKVRFYKISSKEFDAIKVDVEKGSGSLSFKEITN